MRADVNHHGEAPVGRLARRWRRARGRPGGLGQALARLLLLACAAEALAQSAPAERASRVVYVAADYAAFAPQTALDMVLRTPGFLLDDGDPDVRGFGGAAGNVLVDGARPVSKSGVRDALSRIAASQVERIELIRNAGSAETQGQSLVLNVVRKQAAASGTWSVEVERNGNGKVYPRIEASRAQQLGAWETSLRANAFWEEFPFYSVRQIRDAQGDLLFSIATDLPSTLANAYLSGDARRALADGELKVTARAGRYHYYYDQPGEIFFRRLPDGRPDRLQRTRFDERRWDIELGAEFSRDFTAWRWKSLALASLKDGEEAQRDPARTPDGVLVSNTLVDATATPLELVVRSTFARKDGQAFQPELGAEFAFNRLDSQFALSVDQGSGPMPVSLPGADVRVEERRVEVFSRARWVGTASLSVDAELAAEASRITVSGDARQAQSFSFLKPSVALTWRPSERLQWQLGARRRVGQLSFADFAASASLTDGTSTAGNPDLGPDQTTRYYTSIDFRGGGDLAANLEVFSERRHDVLEQVLLPSGGVGLANAGEADYDGVKASLALPLDGLLESARLSVDAEYVRTAFADPLIGRSRRLSRVYMPRINTEFRHDPAGRPFSWGLSWTQANTGYVFRVDEIDRARTGDTLGAFIETGALGPFRTRLALRNIGEQRNARERRFFDGDRGGAVIRTETRAQRSPLFLTLTISASF